MSNKNSTFENNLNFLLYVSKSIISTLFSTCTIKVLFKQVPLVWNFKYQPNNVYNIKLSDIILPEHSHVAAADKVPMENSGEFNINMQRKILIKNIRKHFSSFFLHFQVIV